MTATHNPMTNIIPACSTHFWRETAFSSSKRDRAVVVTTPLSFLQSSSYSPLTTLIHSNKMKLDATVMRTMNRQDFVVLEAVERGMKNHALVPLKLVSSIANLRHGGVHKIISSLLRDKLLSHDCTCGYDGYRLTNSGYDILALHFMKQTKHIVALGDRIGTGKESDVYLAATPQGTQVVLKFHRLGRTSFRNVKKKRDYFQVNATGKTKNPEHEPNSWLFLSRISALKEYSFMRALYEVDYPTPEPLAHNRHVVCMSLLRGMPLYQIHTSQLSEQQAESIFQQSTFLTLRLAKQHGLVHCDLNEFNLLVDLSGVQHYHDSEPYVRHSGQSVATKGALSAHVALESHRDGTGEFITEAPPTPLEILVNGEAKPIVMLIDFPQMVSTSHPNAQELWERDLQCLKRYFVKKLKCIPEDGWDDVIPKWQDVVIVNGTTATRAQVRLDQQLQASGFSEMDASRDLELYYYNNNNSTETQEQQEGAGKVANEESGSEEDDDDEEEEANEQDDADSNVDSTLLSNEYQAEEEDVTTEIVDMSLLQTQRRAIAEEKARARVRRQLEDAKKKRGKQGAFRSRNSNKTYVKGKRVMNDIGY